MFRTILKLSPSETNLIIYAWILMMAAAIAIRLCDFSTLKKLASRSLGKDKLSPNDQKQVIKLIRSSIAVAARRSPLRAFCFEQGLTAQIMLRQRGIPSTLYYGLKKRSDERIEAHVWVMAGEYPVCGERGADQFAVLTKIPSIDD